MSTTTNLSVLGLAEKYAAWQHPLPEKGKQEKNRVDYQNREITKYNCAAMIQNGTLVATITALFLTILHILNPIIGVLVIATGGFIHYTTNKALIGTEEHPGLASRIRAMLPRPKEGEDEWAPVAFNLLDVASWYRSAPKHEAPKARNAEAEEVNEEDGERGRSEEAAYAGEKRGR